MTDTEILEDLKKIVHKQFGVIEENIEEDSYFDSDLNITELELEDLISHIQEKYDINIPDEKIKTIKQVSDLVTFVYENADTAG